MVYNCQLSDQEVNILTKSMEINNFPISLNKECFVKRVCERFGLKKSKEWVILENIGNQGPYYSPSLEERQLMNRRHEYRIPTDQRMMEILQECEF